MTSARSSVADAVVRRALDVELAAARQRRHGRPPRVLDVGGGSGAWAVPLAAAGCLVTVVDSSPNALAALQRRARDAGVGDSVLAMQGDVDALLDVVPPAGADLVLGHGLLEVVDDCASAVRSLAAAAAPGAAVSALVAGRHAAVLARVVAGRLDEARAVLADPAGRWGQADPLLRRMDGAELRRVLESSGQLQVELLQGDGVFDGLVPGSVLDGGPAVGVALAELESRAASDAVLREVAARLHAIARRIAAPRGAPLQA